MTDCGEVSYESRVHVDRISPEILMYAHIYNVDLYQDLLHARTRRPGDETTHNIASFALRSIYLKQQAG